MPLGVLPEPRYTEVEGQLEPGAILVAYTDGLVERRDLWMDEGMERLREMAHQVLDPLPNFHYYFVTGNSHTFLGAPGATTVQGVNLNDWLRQMVADDAGWKTVTP